MPSVRARLGELSAGQGPPPGVQLSELSVDQEPSCLLNHCSVWLVQVVICVVQRFWFGTTNRHRGCLDPGSNRGPSDLRSDALPTELWKPLKALRNNYILKLQIIHSAQPVTWLKARKHATCLSFRKPSECARMSVAIAVAYVLPGAWAITKQMQI